MSKTSKWRHNSLDSLANSHRHVLAWWGRGCEWAWTISRRACARANPIVEASISSQTCACTVVRRSASSKIKLNFRGNFLSSRVVLYSFSCCKANKVVGYDRGRVWVVRVPTPLPYAPYASLSHAHARACVTHSSCGPDFLPRTCTSLGWEEGTDTSSPYNKWHILSFNSFSGPELKG